MGDIHGNYKALLQCLKLSDFDYDNDTLIQLGDVVDGHADSFEVVEELLKIKNLISIKGNHDCLDEETEVFTQRGWLKYNQVDDSDYVIGINTKSSLSSWQKINEVIIKKSDHLNYYSNNKIDFAMTDGHRILYKLDNDTYNYKTISELKYNDRLKIPTGCKTENKGVSCLSDNEIRLVAWILTDGGISKKHGYVTIYQSKVENLEHIENILKSNNLIYTHSKRIRNTKSILGKKLKSIKESNEYKILAECSKKITDRLIKSKTKIPFWCYLLSQRQLEIFLKEIIRGDGSQYNNTENYILYGTKEFLENIQPLFNIAGYSCNLTKSNRNDFRLNISHYNTNTVRQDLNKIKRIEGDFKVWCLNVPFSNFLVRRNNKTYFTGNCWFNQWIETGVNPSNWKQGQKATGLSYLKEFDENATWETYKTDLDGNRALKVSLLPCHIPIDHVKFFRNQLPYYRDEDNNLFIHGGFNRHYLLEDQLEDTFWWDRDLWNAALSYGNMTAAEGLERPKFKMLEDFKEVFIGHTTTEMWNTTIPMNAANIWNLDTGAGMYGRLTIMDVDSKEFWQSDRGSDLYPDYRGRS